MLRKKGTRIQYVSPNSIAISSRIPCNINDVANIVLENLEHCLEKYANFFLIIRKLSVKLYLFGLLSMRV